MLVVVAVVVAALEMTMMQLFAAQRAFARDRRVELVRTSTVSVECPINPSRDLKCA